MIKHWVKTKTTDFFRDDNLLIITWLSYTEHLIKLAKKDIEIFSMICVVYNVANCIMELWAQEFLCNGPVLKLPPTFVGQYTRKPSFSDAINNVLFCNTNCKFDIHIHF